jgi:hypothetical protein
VEESREVVSRVRSNRVGRTGTQASQGEEEHLTFPTIGATGIFKEDDLKMIWCGERGLKMGVQTSGIL